MSYIDLLTYLATHPIESFVIGLVQFTALALVANRINNRAVWIVFSIWFIPQDVIINLVLMTLLGLGELPQEWTVTQRLKRWARLKPRNWREKWRQKVALTIGPLLNIGDPGHF